MRNGNGRKKCVVHVTLGLGVGGQENLLVEFARHADRARFNLRVVSLGGRGTLAPDLEACGVPVEALAEPDGLRPGIVLRLAGLFRRWRADVVHTHDNRPLVYGAPAARLARVPRVVHTKHYGRIAHISRRQAFLEAAAARLADRFVCVSRDSAAGAVAQGVPARKVATVWNGIDLARFTYAGPCSGGPAVLVARLSPEKDIPTLLRAAALVTRAEPGFRLEVAGHGPCLPELQRLAGELGLGERVRFLGEVRDVPGLLKRAGLFVLSSVTEGISLTLLEAMARGLPVVATRVGGNPEVVADGDTGVLVPPGKPEVLAEAVLRVWRDPGRGRELGLAGRRRVEANFEVRGMVSRYEALYEASSLPCDVRLSVGA
jgi:glycosyltransferase involved in cell wall biosynthesis